MDKSKPLSILDFIDCKDNTKPYYSHDKVRIDKLQREYGDRKRIKP